jgi:phosphoribosylformylglycinamidine synthase PurS subunit
MNYKAKIQILPHKELLDPQGKAVLLGLANLGIKSVQDVRVGKFITMDIEAANDDEARQAAKEACEKLLHNRIMEQFQFEIEKI